MTTEDPVDAFQLPLFGLDNGLFYPVHITAIILIIASLSSASAVVVLSFKNKKRKPFFSWNKSDRFIIYMAICDVGFNIFHFSDHIQILSHKNHVFPKQLCQFYGFMLVEFIFSQTLMVNIVAINAFVLVCLEKDISYGKWDWKLLSWAFGLPFVMAAIFASTDMLGPVGIACFLDSVKAHELFFYASTLPLLAVIIVNAVLYAATWGKLYKESKRLSDALGSASRASHASHRAARNMILFVAFFIVQWWSVALYGLMLYTGEPPVFTYVCTAIFSNLGGMLNGAIYMLVRRRRQSRKVADKTTESTTATI